MFLDLSSKSYVVFHTEEQKKCVNGPQNGDRLISFGSLRRRKLSTIHATKFQWVSPNASTMPHNVTPIENQTVVSKISVDDDLQNLQFL